ncbi:1-(5-phosphoribosyl)-5-[(5-phosphoribosylamino)methylideneamino]imidazole-4-carboxamide isomerase [Candidatus Endomicrobiellum devescovinae]|jgi:phosphoribosylformimino-5-aminoimidazole carboxamide ribotide isomerase|uniref:1-(5-phosphoribosyl)-5-[(5- phosphoribosylamino)methylideneamino]imidazole-4- carboxamide isomerase n=1 Tax=Candidatus Endomicrobiellum devescovinae TaxID=3242322 RepID=UPI0028250739|nr:1-(5-phosphoribosyl)-5-[(5-phosphoribosylamino)methylideneamino]imidazole-4-carboxamide isomerase [Endomicrobium sp.]
MTLIPAIDIRQGNSVRLKQGKIKHETIYSNDPVSVAKIWASCGAKCIHVVDLDGAFSGESKNKKIIKRICNGVDIPVHVGGGIRSLEKISEIFSLGAAKVVLGTIAVSNIQIVKEFIKEYGKERIIVAVDAKDEKVAVNGWNDITSIDVLRLVDNLKEIGVQNILYTDISRDGMFYGPDYKVIKKLLKKDIKIIASGGIRTEDDVVKLKQCGVFGAIVGSALYKEEFNLKRSIETAEM